MYCTRCGTSSPEGAMFCSGCGVELPRGGAVVVAPAGTDPVAKPDVPAPQAPVPRPVAPPVAGHPVSAPPIAAPPPQGYLAPGSVPPPGSVGPGYVPPVYYQPIPQSGEQYGGFWLRVVAYFVDSLVMAPIGVVVFVILFGTTLANLPRLDRDPDPAMIASFIGAIATAAALGMCGNWLYHALMESSSHQGTLGKKVMGLRVTDMNGNRISFGRASGRFFAKIISGIVPFGIGYAMAGFTEKRQCLHDMIASCLVLKK